MPGAHKMRENVDTLAHALITRHGDRAVSVALARLNKSIDRRDWHARDFWAQVVHAIHDQQRSGPPNNAANDRRTRRRAEARAQR